MSKFIIADHEVGGYFSPDLSDTGKEIVYRRAQLFEDAIEKRQPVGMSYNGNKRLILPHSLFLREEILATTRRIKISVKSIMTTMSIDKEGSDKTIAMDAYQIYSEKPEESPEGWRTFDLNNENIQLMGIEETCDVFGIGHEIDDNVHMTQGFIPREDFVGNWEPWNRRHLRQVQFRHSMIARPK